MNAQYDMVAALLDTDTGWTDAVRKMAKQASIHVLPCEPCLEALLLFVKDEAIAGKATDQLKRAFERCFGCSASEMDWARHVDMELISRKAGEHPVLGQLIQLFIRLEVAR